MAWCCLARRVGEHGGVIASVAFRNFKALRNAHLALAPFNLVIGPNGSGKTSLVQAMMRLRTLSALPLRKPIPREAREVSNGPEITFRFLPPFEMTEAVLACESDVRCDLLQVTPADEGWPRLRERIQGMRSYVLDHREIANAARADKGDELASDGHNLAAVITRLQSQHSENYAAMRDELVRILPEYADIACAPGRDGLIELGLILKGGSERIVGDAISQGSLYLLALLALAFHPSPPTVLCIEEVDRGFHPRLLREVRDVLYRLSHPTSFGWKRDPVQVIATTHSPYLLDLFGDHPEEVVISAKHGTAATFSRLADRADLQDLLAEGTLGDMWYTGILGGVPEETHE